MLFVNEIIAFVCSQVPIVIDVVANEGFLWVKVVARSAEGLWNNWTGSRLLWMIFI